MAEAKETLKKYAPGIDVKFYRFGGPNDPIADDRPENTAPPTGNETGARLGDGRGGAKKQTGTKLVAEILLTDGANNGGKPPLLSATQLRQQQIPVIAVGFGLETAGSSSKDLSVRELKAGPTVFVKQESAPGHGLDRRPRLREPADRGRIARRGGASSPVATKTVTVPKMESRPSPSETSSGRRRNPARRRSRCGSGRRTGNY